METDALEGVEEIRRQDKAMHVKAMRNKQPTARKSGLQDINIETISMGEAELIGDTPEGKSYRMNWKVAIETKPTRGHITQNVHIKCRDGPHRDYKYAEQWNEVKLNRQDWFSTNGKHCRWWSCMFKDENIMRDGQGDKDSDKCSGGLPTELNTETYNQELR